MYSDSTCTSYLSVAGRSTSPSWRTGGARLGSCSCGGLVERTAAGSWSLSLDLLAILRMLCSVSVSCVLLLTVSDLPSRRKKQAWKEVALHPPLFARLSGSAGAEQLLLQRNASTVGLQRATFACLRVSICMWSQYVRQLDTIFLPSLLCRAGWGGAREEGKAAPALAAAHALAGPAAYGKNTLLRLFLLCYVADCA